MENGGKSQEDQSGPNAKRTALSFTSVLPFFFSRSLVSGARAS